MSGDPRKPPAFDMDPGAFNAALFEAYKGDCNCNVCKILRTAVQSVVKTYMPKEG